MTVIDSENMVEEREWDGSQEMLQQLEAKVQNYFSFIVDGQLASAYPAYVGKPIELSLHTSHSPDPETAKFIEAVRLTLAEHKIGFRVSQLKVS